MSGIHSLAGHIATQLCNARKRRERGVTLIELLLVLGVASLLGISAYTAWSQHASDSRSIAMALQIKSLQRSAEGYVRDNLEQLRGQLAESPGETLEIDIEGDLLAEGYLQTGGTPTSPYGHAYRVLSGTNGTETIEILVLAENGDALMEDIRLNEIALLVGAAGGSVSSRMPTMLSGTFGGYAIDLTRYYPGAVDLSGRVGSVLFVSGGSEGAELLHRHQVPGVEDANRMHTDLDMNSNSLDNVAAVDALWKEDEGATDAAFTIRRENGDSSHYILAKDGSQELRDSGGESLYTLATDGALSTRDLRLREGAEICQENRAGCGLSFGEGDAPKLANNGRWLALKAASGGAQGLRILGQDRRMAAEMTPEGAIALFDGLHSCQDNPGSCALRIANGGSFHMDSPGSLTFTPSAPDGSLKLAGANSTLLIEGSAAIAGNADLDGSLEAHGNTQIEGDLHISGRLQVGRGENHMVAEGGRVISDRGLRPMDTVIAGTACSRNGLIGRSAGGATMNCVDGVWSEISVVSGMYLYFDANSCPDGWVLADGRNGTVDLRGEFIRAWDNGRGVDGIWNEEDRVLEDRPLASFQEDNYGRHHHYSPWMKTFNPNVQRDKMVMESALFMGRARDFGGYQAAGFRNPDWRPIGVHHDYDKVMRTTTTGSPDTRPKNIAMLACMKE